MNEVQWLVQRAEKLAATQLAELTDDELRRLEDQFGPEAVLSRRHDAYFVLSNECFRAGLFTDAARYFRLRQQATRDYADFLGAEGDEQGAAHEMEELARHSWAIGDLDLFRRYVEEGSAPHAGTQPRLDVYPAMFMAWSVLGEAFHGEHWLREFEATVEKRRRDVRARWGESHASTVGAVTISTRLALAAHWLCDHEGVRESARRALQGFRDLGQARPEGFSIAHKRAWLLRTEGLLALAEGRGVPARLGDAADVLSSALAATALTRCPEWKDLVILRLTALHWRDPDDPTAVEFGRAFPHLAHLLDRDRQPPAGARGGDNRGSG